MPYKIRTIDDIIIYGTGPRGISIAKKLLDMNYNVVAFCDIRAREIGIVEI